MLNSAVFFFFENSKKNTQAVAFTMFTLPMASLIVCGVISMVSASSVVEMRRSVETLAQHEIPERNQIRKALSQRMSDVSDEEVSGCLIPEDRPLANAHTPRLDHTGSRDFDFRFIASNGLKPSSKVSLRGSWNRWKQQYEMTRKDESNEFILTVRDLPNGLHHFKFTVDSKWTTSKFYPVVRDERGNVNNVISTEFQSAKETSSPPLPKKTPIKVQSAISEVSEELREETSPSAEFSVLEQTVTALPGPDVEFLFPMQVDPSAKVTLCGSWNGWSEHYQLPPVGNNARSVIVRGMPPGLHHFKFIVNDEWITCHEYPHRRDDGGHINNVVLVGAPDPSAPPPPQLKPEAAAAPRAGGRAQSAEPRHRAMALLARQLLRALACAGFGDAAAPA